MLVVTTYGAKPTAVCRLDHALVVSFASKVDSPGTNDGVVRFDRSLHVREVEDGVNVSIEATPLRRRHVRRYASGAGIDLTPSEARELRDALSAWLEGTAATRDSP